MKYPIHIGHFNKAVNVSVQTLLRLLSSYLTLESLIQWSKHAELEISLSTAMSILQVCCTS